MHNVVEQLRQRRRNDLISGMDASDVVMGDVSRVNSCTSPGNTPEGPLSVVGSSIDGQEAEQEHEHEHEHEQQPGSSNIIVDCQQL